MRRKAADLRSVGEDAEAPGSSGLPGLREIRFLADVLRRARSADSDLSALLMRDSAFPDIVRVFL